MALDYTAFLDLTPEFDYVKLSGLLNNYAHPRDQITKLIRNQKIIRVKKGIYVLGSAFKKPYSTQILANMIYGPSYVSGISALAFYNLIPERTEVMHSHTPNRNKMFETPIGRFRYKFLPMKQYCVSIERIALDERRSFLIASQEKALIDLLSMVEGLESTDDVMDWLASMRIDMDDLHRLRISELNAIRRVFPQHVVDFVIEIVRKVKE